MSSEIVVAAGQLVVSPKTQAILPAEVRDVKLAEARDAQKTISALTISDQTQNEAAGKTRQALKENVDYFETLRKTFTAPLLAEKGEIDDYLGEVRDAFKAAYEELGRKIADYVRSEDERAKAALRAAVEAHNAGDHETGRQLTAIMSEAAVAKAPSGTSVRFEWEAQIVDAQLVPRNWCIPDEKRIAKFAKSVPVEAGEPEAIPGVVYVQVPRTSTRKART